MLPTRNPSDYNLAGSQTCLEPGGAVEPGAGSYGELEMLQAIVTGDLERNSRQARRAGECGLKPLCA